MLVGPDSDEFDRLVEDMHRLMEQGNGETIFEVGAGEGTSHRKIMRISSKCFQEKKIYIYPLHMHAKK